MTFTTPTTGTNPKITTTLQFDAAINVELDAESAARVAGDAELLLQLLVLVILLLVIGMLQAVLSLQAQYWVHSIMYLLLVQLTVKPLL